MCIRRQRRSWALSAAVALLLAGGGARAQEFTFGVEEAVDLGAASTAPKDLDKGLRLYDGKDYAGATLEFHKVLSAKDPESERFKPKAQYSMGKALYRLGFLQSSLAYFNKIVEQGKEHKYYRATLKWLYLIHRNLGDPTILAKIATYEPADYPEDYRARIAYLVGKHHYLRGNLDDALSSLQVIDRSAEEYAKAKFLEGILWVRKNQAKPAAEAFREILRVLATDRSRVEGADDLEELAWLSLARLFYATAQYDLAIKYYDKIPQSSEHWLQALFEESWAYFQLNKFEKALGNLHTLNSPFFDSAFFPESMILQAVILFSNCKYKPTRASVEKFMSMYPPLEQQIDTYLQRYAEPNDLWDFLVKINTRGERISSGVRQIFHVAFNDKELVKRHRYIKRLDEELKKVARLGGPWGSSDLAGVIQEDLHLVRSLAVHEAGSFARSRLERVKRELQELKGQALKIKFEVANAEVGRLEGRLRDELFVESHSRPKGDLTATDEEHIYWPFRGEYWKDELGFYYYYVRSECGR